MLKEAVEALERPGVAFADVLEAHYMEEVVPTVKEAHALGVLEGAGVSFGLTGDRVAADRSAGGRPSRSRSERWPRHEAPRRVSQWPGPCSAPPRVLARGRNRARRRGRPSQRGRSHVGATRAFSTASLGHHFVG